LRWNQILQSMETKLKPENFLWVEKYRPKTIEECVLPVSLKSTFSDMVAKGEPQNLLFSGTAGVGKTTVAKALCNEMGCDWILINCSEEGNIDTLRTKIRQFASTVSLSGDVKKVVILDEFDYSNANSIQPALRGAIEEFANNCRFILTCNYKSRIIEPIHSRCTCIDFALPTTEKPTIAAKMMERCVYILNQEGVKFDKKVLGQLIMKHFPDMRRILNELQRYAVSGSIDVGILNSVADSEIKNLVSSMRNKDFAGVRRWAAINAETSPQEIYRKIYDALGEVMENQSVPEAILILAESQYRSAFVADQEINLVACLVQIMMSCAFK
jgi:DNA polymerase III delta prime subunit